MDLDEAIKLLRSAVKNNGTNDQKHIDLALVPVKEQPLYEKALVISQMSIIEGKISRDEFLRRVHLLEG